MENDLMESMKLISLITEEIIKIIESNDYSDLQSAIEKRQTILDSLQSLEYCKDEYKEAEIKFGIKTQQQQLLNIIESRRAELKENMQELTKNKTVAESYNYNRLAGAKIFSKKI